MRVYGVMAVLVGSGLMLGACGDTVEERAATGGLGGAAGGAVVGGPAGAAVGGAAGAGHRRRDGRGRR